jgi:hypothetical protein
MTTQAGVEEKERDLLAQCVPDAYQMLGPEWLADQAMHCRVRGDQLLPPELAQTTGMGAAILPWRARR